VPETPRKLNVVYPEARRVPLDDWMVMYIPVNCAPERLDFTLMVMGDPFEVVLVVVVVVVLEVVVLEAVVEVVEVVLDVVVVVPQL